MTEKYCLLTISLCSSATDEADCENCELNKRFVKRTIDNWESYIVDRKTEKEYGIDIDPLINLLNEQEEEIQRLKIQLQTDDVCNKCKHEYLVQQNDGYYISKCKKGFDECSKGTIKYCEDFELGDDVE